MESFNVLIHSGEGDNSDGKFEEAKGIIDKSKFQRDRTTKH